eukprot:PhF_6_TR622/c0_g1_i2/m.818
MLSVDFHPRRSNSRGDDSDSDAASSVMSSSPSAQQQQQHKTLSRAAARDGMVPTSPSTSTSFEVNTTTVATTPFWVFENHFPADQTVNNDTDPSEDSRESYVQRHCSGLSSGSSMNHSTGGDSVRSPREEDGISRFIPNVSIPCAVVQFKSEMADAATYTTATAARTIYYKVEIQARLTKKVVVLKRYSDFETLYKTLKQDKTHAGALPPCPSKHIFSKTNTYKSLVEARRIELQEFLRKVPLTLLLSIWGKAAASSTQREVGDDLSSQQGFRIHQVLRYTHLGDPTFHTPLEIHLNPFAQLRYNPLDGSSDVVARFQPGESAAHVAPRIREITDLATWVDSCGDLIPDAYETTTFLKASYIGQTLCPVCQGPLIAAARVSSHQPPQCGFGGHTWIQSAKSIRSHSGSRRNLLSSSASSKHNKTNNNNKVSTRHLIQSIEDPSKYLKSPLC